MNNKSIFHFAICSLTFITVVMVLFPTHDIAQKSELPAEEQPSPRTYVAQISFDVLKNQQEMDREKERAMEKVHPVFQYNEEATKRLSENFEQFMLQIEAYGKLKKEISSDTIADQNKIKSAGDLYQSLSQKIQSTTALNQLTQNEALRDTLKNIFRSILLLGISNTLIADSEDNVKAFKKVYDKEHVNYIIHLKGEILLVKNNKETLVETSSIRPMEILIDTVWEKHKNIFSSNPEISNAFYEVLYAFAIPPNIIYLDKETERRKAEAATQVSPSKRRIRHNTEIIQQGTRVTKETLEVLEAMQNALQKDSNKFSYTAPYGQRILLMLILSMLCLSLWKFRNNNKTRPLHIWAITIIAVMQVFLFYLVHNFLLEIFHSEHLNPFWFYPFAFAPILIAVLFPLRTALALAIWSSVLFGLFSSYDLAFSITSYLISFVMCLILTRIRYRIRFLQAMCAGVIVFAVSLIGILLLKNSMSWSAYWQNFLAGATNLLVCVTFISVFCNVFERIFQITTNLRLAELSDFNHPLLRQLSEYAPGSFHHCIQVGNLGEIAGERIGANTLLIRVMALYHDIGKTMRPEFFTENQRFGFNPHDNLSPYDSIKILRAHVERGVEFAEEYNLPDPIIAGIKEHHGTASAYYFYNKAKEMYPDREVKFSDFCYKNITPQSKETAILMLADSIEAISRSMQNKNTDQLSKMIQKTIEDKMFDDQLNDSGLTMHDLKELNEGFLQGLEGSTHSRVQYPAGSAFSKKRVERGE